MTPAAISALFDDQTRASDSIDERWQAIGDIDCHQPEGLRRLEDYFRENIREPIMFQQTRLFPALLELEPTAAPIVRDARAHHTAVLAACSRLFMELAECISTRRHSGESCLAKERGRAVLDEVTASLMRSNQLLLPLLRTHRSTLADHLQPEGTWGA